MRSELEKAVRVTTIALATLLMSVLPAHAVRPRSDGAIRLYARSSAQNPAFSPDGQTLLFTSFHAGYTRGRAGLYELSLGDGKAVRLLDELGQQSVNLPGAAWNGPTNRITFASNRFDTDEIWTVAPDGSNLLRVTTHVTPLHYQEPSFSPDGQWIVFEVETDAPTPDQQQGSIWKVRADGSNATQLTDGPGTASDDRQPNWSPSGDRIVFRRRGFGADEWNLYAMATDGSAIQQITTSGRDSDPSWSPDGQQIVYSSDQDGLPRANLWSVAASGGLPVRVTRDATHADGAPSWSPDATFIVFASHRTERARASLWRIAAPVPPPPPISCPQCWHPALNTSWQWQLTGTVDQGVAVSMYDIDLFDNDASVVASLHAQGRTVICYISAGSWENWRPDAAQFPDAVKGRTLSGFPDERWLDIRQLPILGPLLTARLDACQSKGFDGVEFDNVDGYDNSSGFPLTYGDQITFNVWLANAAHARGLSVALKNDLDQIPDLVSYFDWALNEQCFQYQECDRLQPFIDAGKAVMQVEYTLGTSQFCPQANALNFNSMKKHLTLDAFRMPCR